MNKFFLNFILNASEKIVIGLEDALNDVDYCYRTDIVLLEQNQKILLSTDTLHYDMERFSTFLQKALNNQLQLHESITQDIGYLCNEYYQKKDGFVIHNFNDGGPDWIGYQYHLWEASRNNTRIMTWLYNNTDGAIIFEVTPCYPYFFCEPEEEPNYIPYDEWIKTYKPYLIKKIPKKIAQEWLDQAKLIVKTIEKNVEKWENDAQNNI
jgi:hypothetical protein